MNSDFSFTLTEFVPLVGAVALGAVCAGAGLVVAKRANVGAFGRAVPRIAVHVLAIAGLVVGLGGMTGVVPGMSPVAILAALLAGFVGTSAAEWSLPRTGAGVGVAGTIRAAERRRAA